MTRMLLMFDLCLFDLDNTLLRTDDLDPIRKKGVDKRGNDAYRAELLRQFGNPIERYIYTPQHIANLKARWPNMTFGIFTRSPRAYADAIISASYPLDFWNWGVCYEDVPSGMKKPNGEGIRQAMRGLNIVDPSRVVMIGDESADVKAAYNAGCYVVLDKSSWPRGRWDGKKHFSAIELIPDAVINRPGDLLSIINDIEAHAPCLEWELNDCLDGGYQPRFERSNNFYDPVVGEPENAKESISYLGRHFAEYESLRLRRNWHMLTEKIHANKDSLTFPDEWCTAVYKFLKTAFPAPAFREGKVVVAAIPARPGRVPRMQSFIHQLAVHFSRRPPLGRVHSDIYFSDDLLHYLPGVRSNSGEKLKRPQRFENIRDHLRVANANLASGKDFLIIDDVCTSGATLMYAKKRLLEAGARNVELLALSKNISDVLPKPKD